MMEVTRVKLPTHFEEVDPLDEDSRFKKVRIYIAHTGENLNHSIFSRDVLENMIPTLGNIPILGYVGANKDDEQDFRGHERLLTVNDNDEVEVKFNTHAYGFIPEANNAHFEITGGKEWLVADGYLWTRFVDAMKLFDDAQGAKGQSMEVDQADGYINDEGKMVFSKAKFTGLCILGDDVPPAMAGSVITTAFSKTDFKTVFEEMMAEFSAMKGAKTLPTKKKDETKPASTAAEPEVKDSKPAASAEKQATSDSAETKATASSDEGSKASAAPATAEEGKGESPNSEPEVSADSGEDNEEMACGGGAGSKKKKKGTFKKDENNPEDDAEDVEDDPEEDDDKKKKNQFTLTLTDQQYAFMDAVRASNIASGECYVYPIAVYSENGIVQCLDGKGKATYYNIAYSTNADDSIKLGDKTEVFPSYLTASEKKDIESRRAKLEDLQNQINELQAYKNGIEMSKKEDALAKVSAQLPKEDADAIRASFSQKSVEEVEKDIAFSLYKHGSMQFSTTSTSGMNSANFSNAGTQNGQGFGYGEGDKYFHA